MAVSYTRGIVYLLPDSPVGGVHGVWGDWDLQVLEGGRAYIMNAQITTQSFRQQRDFSDSSALSVLGIKLLLSLSGLGSNGVRRQLTLHPQVGFAP